MMRDAHLCLILHFMDRLVCGSMPFEQIAQDLEGGLKVIFAWGKSSTQVSATHVHVRLVNCDPHVAMISERFNHPAGKSREQFNGSFIFPPSHLCQPHWIGEMMQCDHRHHVALF